MRTDNAYLTQQMAERRVQQSWDAFCQSGSIPDYLRYRSCRAAAEGDVYADTSDGEGRRTP